MKISSSTLTRLKAGEEEAFDSVYQTYFGLVKHVVLSLIPSDSIAEDITQETFLRMYENIHNYKKNISFTSYLVTIARNLALNYIQKEKRITSDYDMTLKENDSPSPEEEAYHSLLLERIRKILSKEEYEIFLLRACFDLSFKEIDDIYHMGVSSITNKYHRALKKVKDQIKE